MKGSGIHEGCIEQIQRLYADRLFSGKEIPTDEKGRIRVDDWGVLMFKKKMASMVRSYH
jgi:enoyl-[acyl-carrier protein] reductase/trans-2-enoyl-CoA reductase (NAD+)